MVSVTQKAYFIILRLAQSNYCLPTLCVQEIVNASACFDRLIDCMWVRGLSAPMHLGLN